MPSRKRTRRRKTRSPKSEPRRGLPVLLGLGANLDAPRRQLLDAIAALSRQLGPVRVAPLYRTAPVSPIPQPDFLNTVVLAWTAAIDLDALHAWTQQLERQAGRCPGPRWGPRPLDVDLLIAGDLERRSATLTLPHPRLRERRFVLAPLAALVPALPLPPDGATAAELLARLPPGPAVELVAWSEAG